MIQFAGLAPDERTGPGSGELTRLGLPAAIALGARLRRTCRRADTTEQAASVIADAINSFDHDARPACVLVRGLVAPLAGPAEGTPEPVRLVATRGLEPAWNDVERSRRHPALPVEPGQRSPLVDELVDRLRLGEDGGVTSAGFVLDAATFERDAAAAAFARSYDVRALIGVAAVVGGRGLLVVGFCRAPIDAAATPLLDVLAHYARAAWLATGELQAGLGPAHAEASAEAVDELLALHERLAADVEAEHERRLERVREAARDSARAAAATSEQQAAHLQRAQRAMVNVIEDLRLARASLAVTVEQRTRELATANRQLEGRNRELEEFVYIASHDLQEPLRTVAGYLQLVKRRYAGALGVDADEYIGFAIDGAHRMQALIDSLLLYSRVASSERALEEVPLDQALDGAIRNLALRVEETSASILREGPLPTVHGDRIQLVQLFQNLLSNAIKFSGPRPPRVHVAAAVAGGTCTVTVRDEGLGFNPRFADRIFKIFRRLRRDTPGTGVGLAVCKKIVERHGGTISADARPDEGATFTIELPAGPAAEAS